MKAINIQWEVDNEDDLDYLPSEIIIPDGIDEEDICDYLSDTTGFLHNGYQLSE